MAPPLSEIVQEYSGIYPAPLGGERPAPCSSTPAPPRPVCRSGPSIGVHSNARSNCSLRIVGIVLVRDRDQARLPTSQEEPPYFSPQLSAATPPTAHPRGRHAGCSAPMCLRLGLGARARVLSAR